MEDIIVPADTVSDYFELFTLFDKDGDGRITPEEFEDVMRTIGFDPENDIPRGEIDLHFAYENGSFGFRSFIDALKNTMNCVRSMLRQSFDVLDEDGDGFFSRDQFCDVLTKLGAQVTDEELDELFRDLDGDDQISFQKYVEYMKPLTPRSTIQEFIRSHDETGLDKLRMADQLTYDQIFMFNEALIQFGKEHDGSITYEELQDMMRWLGYPIDDFPAPEIKEEFAGPPGFYNFSECLRLLKFMMKIKMAKIKQTFRVIDRDKDGFISPAELRDGIAKLAGKFTDEYVDKILSEDDHSDDDDDDGEIISYEEFFKALKSGSLAELRDAVTNLHVEFTDEELEQMLCEVELDSNGQISNDEIFKALIPRSRVELHDAMRKLALKSADEELEQMLCQLGLDGNDLISYEGFITALIPGAVFEDETEEMKDTSCLKESDETEEMNGSCVDCALNKLSELEGDSCLISALKEQMQTLQMDLQFIKLYIWCLTRSNFHSASAVKADIEATLGDTLKSFHKIDSAAMDSGENEDWDVLVGKLRKSIQLCKPNIAEMCSGLLDCPIESKFSVSELQKLMNCIVISLNNLVHMKSDSITHLKSQIEALKEKVNLFPLLVEFSMKRSKSRRPLEALVVHIQAWARRAACLSILCWAEDEMEENKVSLLLANLLQEIRPHKPEIIEMYLSILRASKAFPYDIAQTGEVVVNIVDLLLENMTIILEDGIEAFREGLITLIIFLMEKPYKVLNDKELKLVQEQADDFVDAAASFISSFYFSELKESILEQRSIFLHNFNQGIDILKANISELYPTILDSSSLNYPTINIQGFIDLLLENLDEMLNSKHVSIPFIKRQIVILREELSSLRFTLKDMQQLQDGQNELKELWVRIANMAYHAANAVNSFRYNHQCLWIEKIWFSSVTEDLKVIKSDVLKAVEQQVDNMVFLNAEGSFNHTLHIEANTASRVDEVVVGLEDESAAVIDLLTIGSKQRGIVSIIGMPGIGKTTLAKKVYDHPSVKSHFHKRSWTCVSQSYNIKKLLMHILRDVTGDGSSKMDEEDLAEQLYRSLKGNKYLIIMDDIWDIEAWNALQLSFPNDGNGSRIIFTSRISDIALQAESKITPFVLHPLSDEKGWKLLRQKLFKKLDACPPTFMEVGIQVVKICKGSPLAIVVIAGLLAERVESLDWWKQIAEGLGPISGKEGCKDILEFSYKHLPETLRPCFLYLGLFKEDTEIRVQRLIRLWISEGFVRNSVSGAKSLEEVATEYLMSLVTRSLVNITRGSSTEGIKVCHIHDLLRDFCLTKGEAENFFRVKIVDKTCDLHPWEFTDKHYRLCVQNDWSSYLDSNPNGPCLSSLMIHPEYGYPANCELKFFRLTKFEYLRVLDIDNSFFIRDHVLEAITSLVMLRYLAITGCHLLVHPSIANLVNLETISVQGKVKKFYLPWKMKKLRHVNVKYCSIRRTIRALLCDDEPGKKHCRWEDLRTLSQLSISSDDQPETLFRRTPRVRKLKFKLQINAPFPELHLLTQLEALNAKYKPDAEHSYPYAIDFPSTLKKLTLKSFRLPWCAMSLIGKLRNLQVLKLLKDAFSGERWEVEDDQQFMKLKFLELMGLNFTEWNASDEAFPCLEMLVVKKCSQLEEIPCSFAYISTLTTIKLRKSRSELKNSARQIQEEQISLGNEDLMLDLE